jgi:hypothetical protein
VRVGVSPRRRGAALLFLLLCAGLAGAIYLEAQQAMEAAPAADAQEAAPPSERARQKDPTFAMPPLNSFAEVVARPLFSPTRRPPAASTGARPANFTLVGIVISPQERHALLAHGLPSKVDRVTEGQSLDGWTVKSIGDNGITLVQGENEIELKPSDKAGPGQGPPQPYAAPPAATSPIRPQLRGSESNAQTRPEPD